MSQALALFQTQTGGNPVLQDALKHTPYQQQPTTTTQPYQLQYLQPSFNQVSHLSTCYDIIGYSIQSTRGRSRAPLFSPSKTPRGFKFQTLHYARVLRLR